MFSFIMRILSKEAPSWGLGGVPSSLGKGDFVSYSTFNCSLIGHIIFIYTYKEVLLSILSAHLTATFPILHLAYSKATIQLFKPKANFEGW